MLELEKQYKGRTTAEFMLYSYKESKNKQGAAYRALGLIDEIKSFGIEEDFNNFMKEEIIPFIWERDFWLRDAGNYVYRFYDFFVLGFGDTFRLPPDDEQLFSVFNCTTYSLVLMIYDDEQLYHFVKKSGRKFKFF